MDERQPWYRLFGLSWQDFFHGTSVTVDTERDLSLKSQWLDVIIIRREPMSLDRALPDGFEDFSAHNLMTFKSFQETLDGWALNELVGHYVNYRKQISPSMQNLLPETDFRLFAVCARFPRDLARGVPLVTIQEGVYSVRHFTGTMRVIVINQLPRTERNAMLLLFSSNPETVEYAAHQYRPQCQDTSSLLFNLFMKYRREGLPMPMTLEEIAKQTADYIIRTTPPEKLLEFVPLELRLLSLPLEKRLEGVPLEKRLEGVPLEKRLEGLTADEVLRSLSPELRAALAQRLREQDEASS
jgi:hypothetical protein